MKIAAIGRAVTDRMRRLRIMVGLLLTIFAVTPGLASACASAAAVHAQTSANGEHVSDGSCGQMGEGPADDQSGSMAAQMAMCALAGAAPLSHSLGVASHLRSATVFSDIGAAAASVVISPPHRPPKPSPAY